MELLLLVALVVFFVGIAVERLLGSGKELGLVVGIAAAVAAFCYWLELFKAVS